MGSTGLATAGQHSLPRHTLAWNHLEPLAQKGPCISYKVSPAYTRTPGRLPTSRLSPSLLACLALVKTAELVLFVTG